MNLLFESQKRRFIDVVEEEMGLTGVSEEEAEMIRLDGGH